MSVYGLGFSFYGWASLEKGLDEGGSPEFGVPLDPIGYRRSKNQGYLFGGPAIGLK